MYRALGMNRSACAQFLHVSERTLHNWESGRHDIPYAAYRLLRIESGLTIPGGKWENWRIARGGLITPEGRLIDPSTAAWWSLLCRRAETGYKALGELAKLRNVVQPARFSAARGPIFGDTRSQNTRSLPQNLTTHDARTFGQAGVVAPPDSPESGNPPIKVQYQNYSANNSAFIGSIQAHWVSPQLNISASTVSLARPGECATLARHTRPAGICASNPTARTSVLNGSGGGL